MRGENKNKEKISINVGLKKKRKKERHDCLTGSLANVPNYTEI